jgi:predicted RNase H-like nuclease (RuvC/YqgF family)
MHENNQDITHEELARMIARGFEETAKKAEVDTRFNAIEERLDRIERILLEDHRRRIEKLEDQIGEMRSMLAMHDKGKQSYEA